LEKVILPSYTIKSLQQQQQNIININIIIIIIIIIMSYFSFKDHKYMLSGET